MGRRLQCLRPDRVVSPEAAEARGSRPSAHFSRSFDSASVAVAAQHGPGLYGGGGLGREKPGDYPGRGGGGEEGKREGEDKGGGEAGGAGVAEFGE